jgi:hypothetical protein
MELETLILLAAVILISQIALEARRSPTETGSPRLRLLWGLLLAGFVGYVVLSFAGFASLPAADAAQATGPDLDGGILARGALAIGLAVLTALIDWFLLASPGFRRRMTGWLPASAEAIETAPGDRQWPRRYGASIRPARSTQSRWAGLLFSCRLSRITSSPADRRTCGQQPLRRPPVVSALLSATL